jgi:hypothetical protein
MEFVASEKLFRLRLVKRKERGSEIELFNGTFRHGGQKKQVLLRFGDDLSNFEVGTFGI